MSIEHKYIYNGALLTLQELHSAGVLLGNAQPEEVTVYSEDAGALGTRYTSESDGIIVKSEGDIYYYATQAECDAEWTTYEPVPTVTITRVIGFNNTKGSYTSGSVNKDVCYDV